MKTESYNVYRNGRKIYTHLTQDEYFDIMEDLSIEFYQTGSPSPEDYTLKLSRRIDYGYA